jgi:hypothetical protein
MEEQVLLIYPAGGVFLFMIFQVNLTGTKYFAHRPEGATFNSF